MVRAARNLALALAAAFVSVAAVGWLYLVRPPVPSRPMLPEALPLDELPHKGGVPLVTFIVVWAVAGIILGLIARAARLERLTGALLLALAIGALELLTVGISLAVVRQVSLHRAFDTASSARSVYAPAVLAGLGGAICCRAYASARSRAPLLLAWGVAAAAALGLADAVAPSVDRTFLSALALDAVRPITSALVGPLSLALLIAARGLARRKRRAWQVSVALLGGSSVLHLLHGFNAGAAMTALLATALVAYRNEFDAPGDPASVPRLAPRALLLVGGILAYAALALWINQLAADQPVSAAFIVRETGAALVGLRLRGSPHLTGGFGDWFPLSVFVAGVAAGVWLLLGWVGPWRYRLRQEARERALARDLVAAWGADTLAPFVLRADKSYFFSEDELAFLAYRVVGGVAIVSGDPVGPPASYDALFDRFIPFAREPGWRLAILGPSYRCLELYAKRGLHALYHGDEAVLGPATVSLEGPPR